MASGPSPDRGRRDRSSQTDVPRAAGCRPGRSWRGQELGVRIAGRAASPARSGPPATARRRVPALRVPGARSRPVTCGPAGTCRGAAPRRPRSLCSSQRARGWSSPRTGCRSSPRLTDRRVPLEALDLAQHAPTAVTRQVIDVQDATQVVGLVQQAAREETGPAHLDRRAGPSTPRTVTGRRAPARGTGRAPTGNPRRELRIRRRDARVDDVTDVLDAAPSGQS